MKEKRLAFLRAAETGAVSDAMTLLGIEGWMDGIFPVSPDMKVCGTAFTVQFSLVRDPGQKVYNMFEVLDMCSPGDVVVVAASHKDCTVGENMLHALANLGLAGMVLDGKARDCGVIAASGTPLFFTGPAIRVAPNFKIAAVQQPILCGGAQVEPGDYIVGDVDGVISLPKARIDDVIYQAEMVAGVEADMEQALNNGISMQELMKISARKKIPRL